MVMAVNTVIGLYYYVAWADGSTPGPATPAARLAGRRPSYRMGPGGVAIDHAGRVAVALDRAPDRCSTAHRGVGNPALGNATARC